MKSFKFLLSAFFSMVLLSGTAFSNEREGFESDNSKVVPNSIKRQIESLFSNVPVDKEGEVVVAFSVNKEKGLVLSDVYSSNKFYASLVERRLSTSKFYIPKKAEGSYQLRIKFVNSYAYVDTKTPADILRTHITSTLESVKTNIAGKVDLKFLVKDNKLSIVDIAGTNPYLVSVVKENLNNSTVELPADKYGVYQITLNF